MSARSLNPSVEYRALNVPAFWKKRTTVPSYAQAGMNVSARVL